MACARHESLTCRKTCAKSCAILEILRCASCQCGTVLTKIKLMNIANFQDLLSAARQQPEPQRLLFVFAAAELPEGSSAQEAQRFAAGQGGALTPLMAVDKTPDEIASFEALARESAQFGQPWALVFVSSLSGHAGRAPSSADADAPLQRMVASIKAGQLAQLLPFNPQGEPVILGPRTAR